MLRKVLRSLDEAKARENLAEAAQDAVIARASDGEELAARKLLHGLVLLLTLLAPLLPGHKVVRRVKVYTRELLPVRHALNNIRNLTGIVVRRL